MYILLILSILSRLNSFIYIYIFKEKHTKYKLLGNYTVMIPFVRYTDASIFMSIIWCIYKIYYNYVPSYLTCITWCILSNVSIGYWLLRNNIDNTEYIWNKYHDILSNIISHGGLWFIFLLDLHNNPFYIYDICYPIIFSLMWLFFIIVPWYMFTNDSVYPFLNTNIPIKKKLSIFSVILGINIITGLIGSFISNII